MSDNKKYYYLKLKENFYDTEEMIILQNMPDGYLYSDILMKLYLRSLKNNGKLMFKDVIPYTPSALAQVVRHQIGTIEKALKIFQELGLVEILDNGAIYMLDIQNFIGESSTEADRIRNYRARIKKDVQMLQQTNDKSTPEIEKEKEKEKEIDTEIEKNVETNSSIKESDSCVDSFQNVIDFYNNNIGAITPYGLEIFNDYAKEMPIELIILAMKKAVEANIRTIQYIKGILNNWSKKGIKNLLDAEREDEQFRNKNMVIGETDEEKMRRKIKALEEGLSNADK